MLRLDSATLFDGTSADAYMTIGGTISGSGGLTKSGAGLLGLTGANSYTGDTTMNGGTLSVVSDPSLGASSGALIFNGGTLQNTGSFSSARSVVLGTGGGTLQTNADLTLSGDISGSGGIEKTGAGTLILSGDNSYLGATTIQNGVLAVEGGLATPDESAVTVGSSGTYRVTDSEVIGSLAGTGSVIIGSGATLITGFNDQSSIFAGSFSGAGSLEIDGAGTFTVTGNNSLGGDITICCSNLDVRGNFDIGGDALVFGGSLAISNGGRLNAATGVVGLESGDLTVSGGGQLEAAAFGTTTAGNFTVTGSGSLARSGVASFVAILSDSNLNISNGGRLETLADAEIGYGISASVKGANSVWLVGQTLTVGSDSIGPSSLTIADGGRVSAGAVSVGDDSALHIGIGGLSGVLATTTLANAGAVVFNHSDDVSLGTAISGAGSLTKTGTGRLNLTGASTLSGPTYVQAGQLAVNGSLAASAVTVGNNATLSGAGTVGGITAQTARSLHPETPSGR